MPEALAVAEPVPMVDETWPGALPRRLCEFVDYLDRCRPAGRGLPRLRAFDMVEVPDLVAHLILLDPIADGIGPTRYRFRFVGTWHVLTFGKDVTGFHIDELHDDPKAMQAVDTLHGIMATGELHYWRRTSVFNDQQYLYYQRVMAPLADDAGRIARLVGCYDLVDD